MMLENDNRYSPSQIDGSLRRVTTPYTGLGKLPPQACDIEEAVLGALMLDKNSIMVALDILKAECFYKDNHQKIFNCAKSLFEAHSPIDILTLTAQLRKKGELEMVGGAYYLTELTERVTSSVNLKFHSLIIYEKYLQREMIRIGTETINSAYEDTSDVFELIEKNQKETYSLMSNINGREVKSIGELGKNRLLDYQKATTNGLTGLGSGFASIDSITGGWQKKDLIIIAARPAMGKTAFALQIAKNAAISHHTAVAVFSLEMSENQLTDRLISSETGIFQDKLLKRQLSKYDFEELESKTINLFKSKIFIDDTASLSINSLRSKAVRLKQLHNIGLIVIDYLQLMEGLKDKNTNREQEISRISRGLKGLAKDLDIPVIALSQLSREVEKRAGHAKRPMLSDLRESGSIEQDADSVLFLYRPEYYGINETAEGDSTLGLCEVIFSKNRSGICDTANLIFNGAVMKFFDRNTVQMPVSEDFVEASPGFMNFLSTRQFKD